jgi:hypothetical protein
MFVWTMRYSSVERIRIASPNQDNGLEILVHLSPQPWLDPVVDFADRVLIQSGKMHWLAYTFVLIVLIPDWALSGGFRGNRGAIRAPAGFVRSGSTATVRPRLGAFSHSVVGNRIFVPHSQHFGTHFRRGSFVRFALPAPVMIQRFYPPFIYYHAYLYQPGWNRYGYFPYQPGAIIEVPAVSDSTLSSSIMPRMPMEHFAPAVAGPAGEENASCNTVPHQSISQPRL